MRILFSVYDRVKYLHGIQCGTTQELISGYKKFDTIFTEYEILPDPPDLDIILAHSMHRHGIAIFLCVIDELDSGCRSHQFTDLIDIYRLLSLDDDRFAVRPQCRDTHSGAADLEILIFEYFSTLPYDLHLFLGIPIILECVDMRDHVECDILDKSLDLRIFSREILLRILEEFVHSFCSCTTRCLIRRDDHLPYPIASIYRRDCHECDSRRTVRIRDDTSVTDGMSIHRRDHEGNTCFITER